MIRPALARKYAKALVSVAQRKGALARVLSEVQAIRDLAIADHALGDALTSAGYPEPAKRGLVLALLGRLFPDGIDPLTRNFIETLALHHRLSDFTAIATAVQPAVDDAQGVVKARLRTAVPLTPLEEAAAAQALARVTGKHVRLETAVDPELLGGAVTQIGSTIYDGSVRTTLTRMRDRIAHGGTP